MENKAVFERIADKLYAFTEGVSSGVVRAFLITDETEALLIDTGMTGAELYEALKAVTDKPVKVVHTHSDRDHVASDSFFDCAYLHPSEYTAFRKNNKDTKIMPLWEGEILRCGGYELEVVLIPGHTQGSIALLDKNKKVLFSGDSVQNGCIYMFGENRSVEAYIASLKKLAGMKDFIETIYPSHGDVSIDASYIEELIGAAQSLASGELKGEEAVFGGMQLPCKLYRSGRIKFLY